jgi:hypothetical protein
MAATLTGALIRNNGSTFAVVLVAPKFLDDPTRDDLLTGLRLKIGLEAVIAARQPDGNVRFYGQASLVQTLQENGVDRIPWRRLALTRSGLEEG